MIDIAILFLVFNRPEITQRTFDQIKRQQPKLLYVAADGPRINYPDDIELCKKTKAVIEQVDWDCDVKKLYSDHNLGCGLGPVKGINWFFENVEEGIIIEDDCIPNDSFFHFCTNLLERYKNNDQVKLICGTSYQNRPLNNDSYYFSKYPHVWGWASWRRTWKDYNFDISTESINTLNTVIDKTFNKKRDRKMWKDNMKMIVNGLDAWDYQLMYWMWKNDGICITPWKNLISNIGFGQHATHTYDANSSQSAMKQHELIEINHPKAIIPHKKADRLERNTVLLEPDYLYLYSRIRSLLIRSLNAVFTKNG